MIAYTEYLRAVDNVRSISTLTAKVSKANVCVANWSYPLQEVTLPGWEIMTPPKRLYRSQDPGQSIHPRFLTNYNTENGYHQQPTAGSFDMEPKRD